MIRLWSLLCLLSMMAVGSSAAPQRINALRYCDTLDKNYNQIKFDDPESCFFSCSNGGGDYLVVNQVDFVSCGQGKRCLRGACLEAEWVEECAKQNPGTKGIMVHGSPQCTVSCIGEEGRQVKIPAYDGNKCTIKSEDGEYQRGVCDKGKCI